MVAWTLVFHVLGLVFWLGSLLGVTHVLALHTQEQSAEARAALGRLEMKLLKGLAHPGAAIMVISGTILVIHNPEYLREHWLHIKLLLVVILIVLDLRLYFRTVAFQAGRIEMRRGECMGMHGTIALILFLILALVLTKPFGLARYQGPGASVGYSQGMKSISAAGYLSSTPLNATNSPHPLRARSI